MALNNTVTQLKGLLAEITHDLEKGDRGNKAAAQRVRTGTVKLEKVAKLYRKESILHEKHIHKTKPKTRKAGAKTTAKKAHAPAKKAAHGHAKKAAAKKAPAKKAAHGHAKKAHHAPAKAKAKTHKVVAKPK